MKGSESAYSPATAMAAAADNHDGGVGELQGSAASWAELSHAARNLVSEMTALSSLVEMSDAHHDAESSMLNMIMMNRSAPNYIKQLDVEEQQLRHLQQAAPPAAQPHHLMNRIPASPSPHAPAGSATSYINLPGAGIGASMHLSKSVPSSPTFANSLHMHHLLASAGGAAHGAGRAGNPFSLGAKDLSAHLKCSSSSPSSAGLPLLMKTASTNSSMLTASLDLASCTSNLAAAAAAAEAQLRSASCSGDHYPVQQGEIHAAAPASSTLMMMQSPDDTTTSNDYLITLPQFNDHAARLTSATSTSATTANFSGDIPSPLMTSQNSQQVGLGAAKKRRMQHNLMSSSSTALTSTGVDRVTSAAADQADQVGQSRALANNIQQDEAAAPLEAADMSTNNSPINFNHHDGVDHLNAPVVCMKASSTDLQEAAQPPAPKQDYIHVRARRGQATDSHSLAERVRREKISERMKFLQDLVPGCNKITGKAVMLDEIINYVQSLQRQVEFLSMKLSTVSPPSNRYDAAMLVNHVESQPMHQISQSMASNLSHVHDQHPTHQHVHQHNHQLPMPLLLDVQQPHVQQDSSTINGNQVWEDELQSLVQMGYPATLS